MLTAVTQLSAWVVSNCCLLEIMVPTLFFTFCLLSTHKKNTNTSVHIMNITGQKRMTENDRGTNVEKYVGEIKGGLRPTMKITIMGVICPNPKSFSVTLLCDPMDATAEVGLLLAINFTEKSIVRNSWIAGKWGKEEKTIPYFPFTAGDSFKMELLCEHQQIRILLDGRQLCDFTHRIVPMQRVTNLQISGDLKLTKVA